MQVEGGGVGVAGALGYGVYNMFIVYHLSLCGFLAYASLKKGGIKRFVFLKNVNIVLVTKPGTLFRQ